MAASICAASVPAAVAESAAQSDEGRDLKVILSRFREHYRAAPVRPAAAIAGLLKSQAEDGSWPDVDYVTRDQVNLVAQPHLKRLVDLARAHAAGAVADERLLPAIERGVRSFITRDPRSRNWWHAAIGTPKDLLEVLALAGAALPRELVDDTLTFLERPDPTRSGLQPDGGYYVLGSRSTGANLSDMARIQLELACHRGSLPRAKAAVDRLAAEIVAEDTVEGLQPDFSLRQHGPILYSGGYGKPFAEDNIGLVDALRGTSLALPAEKLELLTGYMLDGQQWMIRGSSWDFGVLGRGVTRKGAVSAAGLAAAAELLARNHPARSEEATAFARRLRGQAGPEASVPVGNRHFYRADYMSHSRPGFLATVKMLSTRVSGTESGNREGLKNYHVSDGALCLMKTGQEYKDIFPLWNWRQIPGTTLEQSDEKLPLVEWGKGARGETDFVGGVSNGVNGLAAMDYRRSGVSAKKAYFFFGDQILLLGAGITAEEAVKGEVHTTLDQSWAASDADAAPQSPGVFKHNQITYTIRDGANPHVLIDPRTASWHEINGNFKPTDQASGKVHTLTLNHGVHPRNATYAVEIAPAGTPARPLSILTNTPELQAAATADGSQVQAAFYQSGTLTLGEIRLTVSHPCLLLIDDLQSDSPRLSTSNPLNQPLELSVTLQREGRPAKRVTLQLPGGKTAGSTVTRPLD